MPGIPSQPRRLSTGEPNGRERTTGFETLLEQHHQQKIYPRVMSFGYNADVWMTKSVADLEDPVRNLLHYLELERKQVG